jgi:hypothetical protein
MATFPGKPQETGVAWMTLPQKIALRADIFLLPDGYF